jgi:transcriptional regulator with XRE-family HTH domain
MRLKRTIEVPKLALKIKVALVEANKTVKAVSQEMGISVSQWHSLLKNESVLSYELLLKMEAALGVKFPPDVVGGVGFESVSIYKEGLAATSSIGQAPAIEQPPAAKLVAVAEQEQYSQAADFEEEEYVPSKFPEVIDTGSFNEKQYYLLKAMMEEQPMTVWASNDRFPGRKYPFIDAVLLSCRHNTYTYDLEVECTNLWDGTRHVLEFEANTLCPEISEEVQAEHIKQIKLNPNPWGGTSAKAASRANLKLA